MRKFSHIGISFAILAAIGLISQSIFIGHVNAQTPPAICTSLTNNYNADVQLLTTAKTKLSTDQGTLTTDTQALTRIASNPFQANYITLLINAINKVIADTTLVAQDQAAVNTYTNAVARDTAALKAAGCPIPPATLR